MGNALADRSNEKQCGRRTAIGTMLTQMRARFAVIWVLCMHAALLARSAVQHSPGWDEPGHLVAGVSHWQFAAFDLYRVNPPLVRAFGAPSGGL